MNDDASPLIIGCDHAAYQMKEIIKAFVADSFGVPVEDAGTHSEASVDYVDYGAKVAAAVSGGDFQRGILLCGTGIGMSITANRWPKVRATLCNEMLSAIFSRRHNDSNILVMGARIIGDVHAKEIVRAWFETPFDGGRHQARLEKIETVCRTAC